MDVPTSTVDISGLLELSSKTLYMQQIQTLLLAIMLGLLIVLIMVGGAKK